MTTHKIVPVEPRWYCNSCGRDVPPIEVTYQERHTTCGRVITDDAAPPTTLVTIEADELAELEADDLAGEGT